MRKNAVFVLAGLLLSLLLAGVVSSVASAAPDGLDSASTHGCTVDGSGEITGGTCIAQGARDHELGGSPFADYGAAGAGTAVSGVVGVLVTFGLAGGLFWVVRRRRPAED